MNATVERLMGLPLAKAARKAAVQALKARAAGAMTTALLAVPEAERDDLAREAIEYLADYRARRAGPLEACTHLSAIEGRLAPAIEPPAAKTNARHKAERHFARSRR